MKNMASMSVIKDMLDKLELKFEKIETRLISVEEKINKVLDRIE